jgi:catechol 2,3-dioxygenase-like lactoylglutathione lyase family enzyme
MHRFANCLVFVADMERSRSFYRHVLGLPNIEDHGSVVVFADGFAIHDGAELYQRVHGTPPTGARPWGRDNLVLYLEAASIDEAYRELSHHVDVIHPVREEPWGQRVFRFRDPDGHVIELGEPLVYTEKGGVLVHKDRSG